MKPPPLTDFGAEERYLGGVFMDPRVHREHPLPIAAFASARHRETYEAFLAIERDGGGVTADRLDAELATLGYGATRRWSPYEQIPMGFLDDPEAIVGRLRQLEAARRMANGARGAIALLEGGASLLEAQEQFRRIADLPHGMDDDRTLAQPLHEVAVASMQETEHRAESDDRVLVTTGIPVLDRHLGGGYDRGDLVVIAGDSGAGKSTTMLLAARAQARAGERVLIVTLEDHANRWGRRAVHAATGVPIRALKTGNLSGAQWGAFERGRGSLGEEAIWLAAPLGGTREEVMAAVRRARAQHGITVVVVDYLQAFDGAGDERAMRLQLRDILQGARAETARGGLLFVFGSQYKKREDSTKRPRNVDLYEANYIHQKADAIVHLWRTDDGGRHWFLGKHKDEDPTQGKLVRDERTGLLIDPKAVPASDDPFDEQPPLEGLL